MQDKSGSELKNLMLTPTPETTPEEGDLTLRRGWFQQLGSWISLPRSKSNQDSLSQDSLGDARIRNRFGVGIDGLPPKTF